MTKADLVRKGPPLNRKQRRAKLSQLRQTKKFNREELKFLKRALKG